MKRRLAAIFTIVGLVLIGHTVGAAADDHELPEHPHMLVLGAEVDFSGEEPVLLGARTCVDLAANQSLRLGAHHDQVHFGQAGEALRTRAGNIVVPTAPFPGVPWTDCESFLDFFGVG